MPDVCMHSKGGTEFKRAGLESDVKAVAVLQPRKKKNPEVSKILVIPIAIEQLKAINKV